MSSQNRPAVLVVDDHPDVLEMLEGLLSEAGYPAVAAASGAEALELIQLGLRPCVLLVDLIMPEMDGWQLVAAVRELQLPGLAIVSMSGGDRLMEAPVSGAYLTKPINSEDLLRIVARYCGPPRPAHKSDEG